jgi:hypothetical protein
VLLAGETISLDIAPRRYAVTNPEEYHEIDARGDRHQGSGTHGGFRASFEIPVDSASPQVNAEP